jgi:DNA transformation protein
VPGLDADDIRDMFATIGPIEVRRMFSGAGVYADGTIFALIIGGVLYLKADERNAAAFDREGLEPFSFVTGNGRRTITSYRRIPDRLYDDPEELAVWATEALAAARRKQAAKMRPADRPAAQRVRQARPTTRKERP